MAKLTDVGGRGFGESEPWIKRRTERRKGQEHEGRVDEGRERRRTVFLDRRKTSHLSRELGDLVCISETTKTGEEDLPGEENELSEGREKI